MLQRQVANQLKWIHLCSVKLNCERNAKREQVTILSKIFNVPEEDLLSLWLADKVYDMVKDENVALKALSVTEEELKINPKRKKARK